MNLSAIIFWILAVITVGSAAYVALSRNLVRAGFSLLFTFAGVAGMFVLLHADFLAVTQVIIYVGGALILILFALMFTHNVINIRFEGQALSRLAGLLFVGALTVLLLSRLLGADWHIEPAAAERTVGAIGEGYLTKYLLPFEAVSLLLLMVLVGAVTLVRKELRPGEDTLPDRPLREGRVEDPADAPAEAHEAHGEEH